MIDAMTVVEMRIGSPGGNSPGAHRNLLAMGLARLGVDVRRAPLNAARGTHVACWGWRQGQMLRNAGKQVLVMERGYVGDRFRYTSLGWNGLNNRASFPEYPDDGGARFRRHGGAIRPWKDGGDYILILGQVRGDASLQGRNLTPWYQQVAHDAKRRFGKPVYFRAHPKSHLRGYSEVPGVPSLDGDLDTALSGALFTAAWNSNACLDSVLAGVPCLAGDAGTMAWDVCMHDLDDIVRPAREPLAHRIAWTQWAPDEIESGNAMRKLIDV